MKKGNETITKEERRRRFDEAMTSIQTKFIVEAEEAAPENVKPHREAPAWLRPVAACLAVLILGGLVVFSIPVVNNIISRRGPAELPGTDVAEADTKEEETEKKEETEKPVETEVPVETEAPVVTEEIEVSQFDKKYTVPYSENNIYGEPDGVANASFNDLIHNPYRKLVATAADAAKVTVDMSPDELFSTLGCSCTSLTSSQWDLALDDGTILCVKREILYFDEIYQRMGWWDYVNDVPKCPEGDNEILAKEVEAKIYEWSVEAPIISVEIISDRPQLWVSIVKEGVRATLHACLEQNIIPEWYSEKERP